MARPRYGLSRSRQHVSKNVSILAASTRHADNHTTWQYRTTASRSINASELSARHQLFQIRATASIHLIRVVSKLTEPSIRPDGSTLLSHGLVHSSLRIGFLLLGFCRGDVKVIITVNGAALAILVLCACLGSRLGLGGLACTDLAGRFTKRE
jgi:hypothetical protein